MEEMNENPEKSSSSLAIATEKRTHRPGGCVGIFFQLFDWNRRFAKKKLFSMKLLPPVRGKQASKKFKGGEKMPISKLHLIADENSGGFPNVKKNGNRRVDLEKKLEMRAPGLVARLMGLESMPTVHRDKPKKPSISDNYDKGEEKFRGSHGEFNKEELNLEKGGAKQESRPQKLQRTGTFESRAMTRFGAEALQIKSVLQRSRKHHHHHQKLPSPVKSPRISSGSNMSRSSRLIGAATRFLEPGLQATSRAKCALTYSNSMHYSPKDEMVTEGNGVTSREEWNQCSFNAGTSKPLMGQSSCQNCGNLVDFRPIFEEQPSAFSASSFVNGSSQDSGWNKSRPAASCHEQEKDAVFERSNDQAVPQVAQIKDNLRIHNEQITGAVSHKGQRQWHLSSHECKPQKDEASPIALKHRTQTDELMLLSRDKIPPRSKLSNLQSRRVSSVGNPSSGTKDFVALNRSLSGLSRPRMPTKVDNCRFDIDRKDCHGRDASTPQLRTPGRKRRTINVSGRAESRTYVSSNIAKERNVETETLTAKLMGSNAHSMDCNGRLACQGDQNRADGSKETDIVSFTFNSPIKHEAGIPTELEEKERVEDVKTSFQKPLPFRRDALGVLLEQKLKELTCQEDDELATGTPTKASAAMILQELISALTTEQPCSWDNHMFDKDIAFKTEAEMERLVGSSRERHHLSPGSVLEASFSSSSRDESPVPGHRLRPDSMDYSYNLLQPFNSDADLLDSATSLDKRRTDREMVTGFVRNVSKMLIDMNLMGARLAGTKLTHAKEVILNAELLFGSATPHNLDGMKSFLVSPRFLDELEAFARAAWINPVGFIGLEDTKEGNLLRRFLLDMLIECLDAKYGRYYSSGFKAWLRLPLCTTREQLILDVAEEVRRWTDLAGMIPDEIIEWEMSHSLGKWTDFDIEAFETGIEIDGDILQVLVEEIVMDVWDCRPGSVLNCV